MNVVCLLYTSLVSYDKDGKVKETKLIKPNQWIEFAGGKYYFNKNYDAYNGWQEIDGKMYFFDENSKVHTGWLEVDGKKYYLNQDGVMAVSYTHLIRNRILRKKTEFVKFGRYIYVCY